MLVVDDEPINRIILNKILSIGFQVLEASDGKQAWEMLVENEGTISAMLLDIIMPVMDGYGVLEKISQSGMTDLPVIVITGESGSEAEQKALDAGAWDFVTKPFKPKILLTRIKNAIARSQIHMYEQIKHMSEHDALTGLHNRSRMYADTRRMLDENPDRQFAFIRMDIDHFALFNSSFGEQAGDHLLCYIAQMIQRSVKGFDICTYGRMNADIFCLCIPYDGNVEGIRKSVEKEQRMLLEYRSDYQLQVSAGVCLIDNPGLDVEELYIRASMGSQKCKNQYGQVIGFYDEALGSKVTQEIEITNEMQTALEKEQFVIYLQPKVLLDTDHVSGAEALVRWKHPVKGLISPGEFIPLFEKNGFVAKLDYYVWEKTCQMLHTWVEAGVIPHPVSVNVSRISLYNPNLVSLLIELTQRYQISPFLLQLEVTESAYMTNTELMQKTVHDLRASGFTILMDDFGSEYSSLNTLKSIEVDILKIDMKFLPKGKDMEKGEIILASVIRMANWLGMPVVVEGVETRRQRDFLDGVGCECVQGFFYSPPIPQEEYEKKYVFNDTKEMHVREEQQENNPKYNVTILVIDDDEMDRAIIYEYFKDQYHIYQTDNAEDGLSYLKQNGTRVRLILVDNVMEGMSGLDFIRFCQSEAAVQMIPIIMITANDSVQNQVEAFGAGAYDYITKPLVKEVVMARVYHVMEISSHIRSQEYSAQNFQHQIELDKETGLLNKTAFRDISSKLIGTDTENRRAMMVIDVDDFKKVNMQYGHLVGDAVIKIIADTLVGVCRKTDVIGRFGGDEFILLLSSLPNADAARRKAEEITRTAVFTGAEQQHINLSISIGIAFCGKNDTIDTLFARADQALYEAKSTGKGKIVTYGEEVPLIQDDDKPVVLICGEDPQLYPSIALAYGTGASFACVTSLEELKQSFAVYQERITVICIDIREQEKENADEFYQYILDQGGGERIPIIALCQESDMDGVRAALKLKIQDILTLPPQTEVIKRRLARTIMTSGYVKRPDRED